MLSIAERILLTIWIGSLWTIGYIAAPVTFAVLDDRVLAGNVTTVEFVIVNYIGLVCGSLLLITAILRFGQRWARIWQIWVLIVMLILVAASKFGLQPMMAEIRAQGLTEGSTAAAHFGRLHGLSMGLYLLNSLLGLALVIKGICSPGR